MNDEVTLKVKVKVTVPVVVMVMVIGIVIMMVIGIVILMVIPQAGCFLSSPVQAVLRWHLQEPSQVYQDHDHDDEHLCNTGEEEDDDTAANDQVNQH